MLCFAFHSQSAFASPGVLHVLIRSAKECLNQHSVIWVSPNGSAEFHLKPGKYNVVVNGESGCFVESEIQMVAGKRHELAIALNRKEVRR